MIQNDHDIHLPLFELMFDGGDCCIGGRDSEYSLGSNRPHLAPFGLSLTSIISIDVWVILKVHLSGLIRSLTRTTNLIGLSDEIE